MKNDPETMTPPEDDDGLVRAINSGRDESRIPTEVPEWASAPLDKISR